MAEISFTQEEIGILIDILERRKEELRNDESSAYIRQLIKQMLEKLDAEV